jgi:rod shape-determining protein MreC
METSREDVGIVIRSAFLGKGTKQRFSLFVLIILSIIFLFTETIETKPLNYLRSFIKDTIYRGSLVVSIPFKSFDSITENVSTHINLYENYSKLKIENNKLKNNISKSDFLELENTQLRKLIEEQVTSSSNLASARVMLDKQSPYLNSLIINIGSNKNIKNGMAVLDGTNFIGRIVDVNFFSSRVLLVSDLNSKIPVVTVPSAHHAILSGHGENAPSLEYLPENHNIVEGDKVYTSGKEGIFSPGIPVGVVEIEKDITTVLLFSDLNQITFVNVDLGGQEKDK